MKRLIQKLTYMNRINTLYILTSLRTRQTENLTYTNVCQIFNLTRTLANSSMYNVLTIKEKVYSKL